MKKSFGLIMVVFSLIVLSCVNLPSKSSPSNDGLIDPNSEPVEYQFWHSLPSRDGLVFIGSAGVRSKRDDSIELALQDAARKVSIFDAVEGEFITHNKTGSGFFDYTADTNTSLVFNEDYQGYVENLIFDPDTDVMQYENTIFVRTRYNGSGSMPISYELFNGTGDLRPSWIDNPPKEISGYTVGVGFAGHRASHRDTVNASFEAAIFSIIREISSQITGGAVNQQGSGTFDYRTINENTITARGVLNSFYVLDIWIDKSSKAVWTLAVARISDS